MSSPIFHTFLAEQPRWLHNGQLFYHRCQHLRGGEEPPLLISATLASAYVRWLIGQLDGPQREEALVEWWKFRDA